MKYLVDKEKELSEQLDEQLWEQLRTRLIIRRTS
jgi:hypothetical protein